MSSGLSRTKNPGIRSEFAELSHTVLTNGDTSNGSVAPTSKSTAVRLTKTRQHSKITCIDNNTNQDLYIYVIGPSDDTKTRNLWFAISPGKAFNFDLASNNLDIEARTEFLVAAPTAPTTGHIRMFNWG